MDWLLQQSPGRRDGDGQQDQQHGHGDAQPDNPAPGPPEGGPFPAVLRFQLAELPTGGLRLGLGSGPVSLLRTIRSNIDGDTSRSRAASPLVHPLDVVFDLI